MVPVKHPYIAAYMERKDELTGLGNAVRISVETTEGDIFTQEYMETLRQISDEMFFIPGVARSGVKSLWTPNIRWGEVTEEGFTGGTVVPDDYDGSEASLRAGSRQHHEVRPGRATWWPMISARPSSLRRCRNGILKPVSRSISVIFRPSWKN